MQNLLTAEGQTRSDDWTLLPRDVSGAELPAGDVIVPFRVWIEARTELLARGSRAGVWLASDEQAEDLEPFLAELAIIAIEFPVFSDGRGYSNARILRERLGYQGELRAVGDVLRDQLFLMRRCGFDSFALRSDRDAAQAVSALADFRHAYQHATVDPGVPLVRRDH
jgi:uncharacterized protein (DUF934 family)